MKKLTFVNFILLFLFTLSCNDNDNIIEEKNGATHEISKTTLNKGTLSVDEAFIKENVAITDARIQSISDKLYVKQLVVVNFSNERVMPQQIHFNEQEFYDDGINNDILAGDGIYTTHQTYLHTSAVPFITSEESLSILDNIIIDKDFKHYASLNDRKALEGGPTVTIYCGVKWVCGCWNSCCGFQLVECVFQF